jgi:hypothetical protein
MIVPSQLALKTHTNFGCAASLATLDKLVDRFPLPPVAPTIGDTSLTHVMKLAAHSTNANCNGIINYSVFNLVVGRKILWYFKLKILPGL